MGNEIPGYKPEDVLQTTGENMGAIRDLDLARKMATAEDKTRSRDKVVNKFKSALGIAGDYTELHAKEAAEQAGKEELGLRIEQKAKAKGVTDKNVIYDEKSLAMPSVLHKSSLLSAEGGAQKIKSDEREKRMAEYWREKQEQEEKLQS